MLTRKQYKVVKETCKIDNKDRYFIYFRDFDYNKWSWLPESLNPYDSYFAFFTIEYTKEDAIKRIEEDKAYRLNPQKDEEIIGYY